MKIKGLIEEDLINYKKISMMIIFPNCDLKCDIECGEAVCQNSPLLAQKPYSVIKEDICQKYIDNPLTEAIVMGGLEPFDDPLDLLALIECFRSVYKIEDDIVIYTGYLEKELSKGDLHNQYNLQKNKEIYQQICSYKNITIKFGRYIPNQESHYDEVLGVNLASPNQYGKVVSK